MFDYGRNVHTGFSNQTKEIVKAMKVVGKNEVHPIIDIIASGFTPDFNKETGEITGATFYKEDDFTTVYSAIYHDAMRTYHTFPYEMRGLFGHHLFCEFLEHNPHLNYDFIFIMQDVSVITPMIDELKRIKLVLKKQNKKLFKSIFYFPIDGSYPKEIYPSSLTFFDKLITCTEYGKKEITSKNKDLLGKVEVIPHGIDTSVFYEQHDSIKINHKLELFGANAHKYVVGVINRNQHRKDIPTAIFSFLHAKQILKESGKEDNLFLYLHMDANDPMGWNLRFMLGQTNLKEGIDYCFPSKPISETSNEELNNIYNSIDLYLSTSLGEGFGLTAIECFATGTLCLLPLNTAYKEMIGDGMKKMAFSYPMRFDVCLREDAIIREQGEYEEIGELILTANRKHSLINNKIVYGLKVNAREFVLSKLSWSIISKIWFDTFKNF